MKSKSMTIAERKRMLIIKSEVGCIACRVGMQPFCEANAHHILSAGRRIGHEATIPLCDFHHTGEHSIHGSRRNFIHDYGTEMELLAKTNRLVAQFEASTIGGSA